MIALVNISSLVVNSEIHTEVIEGVDFTVIPSKTMPKNVVMNSILYSEKEVERTIHTLDGSPVTLSHPIINGKFADAYDPISVAKFGFGGGFNRLKGKTTDGRWIVEKLIPTEQMQNTERGKKLAEAIKKKLPIHTSTGVYLNRIPEIGVNELGQEYEYRAEIDRFNHDAILLDEIGAATPEQGVGIFVNADGEQEVEVMYCNIMSMQECEDMPTPEEKSTIISFLSKMLAKLTHNPKHDTMDGESGDMPQMPMNNHREGEQVEKQEAEKMIADALAVNAEQTAKLVQDAVVAALAANKTANEQAEKDALIQQVVNAKLLPEDAAKECGLSALKAIIANQKLPAASLNANRSVGGVDDEFAGYDLNSALGTK